MDVKLPRLGEGADSGTVAGIFVKEGDQVTKDQPLLELESEKAVATIPSPEAGTVAKIHVSEGDEIRVGQLILTLSGDGAPKADQGPAAAPPSPIDATVGDEQETSVALGEPTPGVDDAFVTGAPARRDIEGIPPAASPSIRKLARELGIDLGRVRGSERGGRIVMADVKRYIQSLQQASSVRPAPQQAQKAVPARPAPPKVDFAKWGPVERKKLSKLRATISQRMGASWLTVPRVTQFDEIDITAVMALKKKYDARFEKKDARLTVTAFALKALAEVLKSHPIINASLDEEAGEIVMKSYYHIGIAVDTEQGLIVPVLRDVDKKSLREIAAELSELAERTRRREVSLEEMQGATFTVSNQGGIGGGHFTPIVNTPESAILGMGRGVLKPVVRREPDYQTAHAPGDTFLRPPTDRRSQRGTVHG